MLSLTDQIVGNNPGVGRVVSNDANLCGAGDLVYSHPTEQLSLGLGHELVPGTHDDVRLGPGEQSEGQGCDTLEVDLRDREGLV